ncbi:MAG: aminotransferase class V-fold PLP-dependent enzyme [Planctomycetaceae bacterium]
MTTSRIYLDNAATSFPKPEVVYSAVDQYQRELGCAVGRGSSGAATQVQSLVNRCRSNLAELLGVPKPEHVLFAFNGTDALNLAIHGLLRPGDRVITTCWEHNSVLRPLKYLEANGIQTEYLAPNEQGTFSLDELQSLLDKPTRLVILTHASNVTGCLQPLEEATRLAKERDALVLIDAAQTAGHVPINFKELGADALACPGHKGLLGPLGTGLLVIREGLEQELNPTRQGGTGTDSISESQPSELPARYESGNHNAIGLVGLRASSEWILQQGVANIERQVGELAELLESGLSSLPRVEVLGVGPKVGVVSISVPNIDPQVMASLLDQHFHIETRAGLHCAPRSHAALGTLDLGGAVRFSIGPFTTASEIEMAVEAVAQICAAM